MSVYDAFVWNKEQEDLAIILYDAPPSTLGDVVDRVEEIKKKYQQTDWFEEERVRLLQKYLKSTNKKLGILTHEVSKSIMRLADGAVEAAHQSVTLGGAAYILNKAATASRIVNLGAERGLSFGAYFCIADYDEVQPELTHIRTPLFGPEGNVVSIPVPEGFEHSPVYALPLPDYGWYEDVEKSIREGYRPLFKNVEGHARTLLEERLEQALAITRWAFTNSQSLGDWAARIVGRLFNIEGDLGMPLFSAADENLRKLMVRGMEFLLQYDNRDTFLAAQHMATDVIIGYEMKPGLGKRTEDYVPFFYECTEEGCNRSRTRLVYTLQGDKAVVKGECPKCGTKVEIEVSKNDPDLSDYARDLSPRVDSRQIILDMVIPVTAHVGGPGETAYYAQVIPAAKELGIPFPTFVKYTRMYFNTPWNEHLGKQLAEKETPVLHSKDLFKLIGKVSKFRRKKSFDEMNEAVAALQEFIITTFKRLNDYEQHLTEKLDGAKDKERERLIGERMDVQRYLSWTYGRYAPEKTSQESSWSWIEWVLNSGFADLFGPYYRAYSEGLKNGGAQFINFSL